MPSAAFVVPGRLDTRTGGSIYDRRIVQELRARGWMVDVVELEGTFPFPSANARARAHATLSALDDGARVLVDGLVFGAIPDVIEEQAARLRLIPVVHMPLAHEVGLTRAVALELEQRERRSLARAHTVVVTGRSTASVLDEYGVPAGRIVLIPPGCEPAPLAHGSSGRAIEILCVATLNPGKGHDILIDALAAISGPEWRLTCVGSLTRHPVTADAIRAMIAAKGLERRVDLKGELHGTEIEACYLGADLFALATRRETFGMAVAEALAHGLPVVSTATGAIPELVGSDAGLLAPPGDPQAFADAIARVLRDPGLRQRLAAGAAAARDRLPSWNDSLDKIVAVLETA